jgi:hypothetical protein
LISNEKFCDPQSVRVERLSVSIGRFSLNNAFPCS